MFLLIEKSQEGKTNIIILLCRWKKLCKTWQVWDAGWCGTEGSYSTLQHSLYGNTQLAAAASIATHSALLDFTCYKGKDKGQNIFQRTAANVNDKIMILKLETSAPEDGFGSPFSWCKMGNTLWVRDISQLLPNYSPLKYWGTKFGNQGWVCRCICENRPQGMDFQRHLDH